MLSMFKQSNCKTSLPDNTKTKANDVSY